MQLNAAATGTRLIKGSPAYNRAVAEGRIVEIGGTAVAVSPGSYSTAQAAVQRVAASSTPQAGTVVQTASKSPFDFLSTIFAPVEPLMPAQQYDYGALTAYQSPMTMQSQLPQDSAFNMNNILVIGAIGVVAVLLLRK